jgi:hypothetical protein
VTATIYSYHDQLPEDVDVLLSGPTGKTTMLMADDCNVFAGSITVTFDDAAATAMPDEGPCVSGTFRPSVGVINSTGSNPHPANWTPPAPACPCGTTMSNQNGVNPNGVWNLWALDDTAVGSGIINGGWSLTITTNAGTLTVTKQLVSNPADPGKFNLLIDNVILAACVGNGGTTGPVVEPPNTFHLVSETACAGTNLSNYTPSISCSNGQHTGGTSLFVFVAANANVTCIIRNQRKLFRVGGT